MKKTEFKKSLGLCALNVGKSKDYFYVVKKSNPEFFAHLRRLGNDDLEVGFLKYEDEVNELKNEMATIYYNLHEKSLMSFFYRKYKLKSIYVNESAFIQGLNTMAFGYNEYVHFPLYKKMKVLKEKYEQFKSEVK